MRVKPANGTKREKGKGKREKGKGIPVDLGKITISTIVFFRLHTVLLVI